MATVNWGGANPAQPVQGEMRRFIIRSRIDGTSSVVNASDLNKVAIIKKGWMVRFCFSRIIKCGSTDATVLLMDGYAATFGPTFGVGTINGTIGLGGGFTGMLPGVGLLATGGRYYTADSDLRASFYQSFDGILDIFADVIDTNPYENAGASWSSD